MVNKTPSPEVIKQNLDNQNRIFGELRSLVAKNADVVDIFNFMLQEENKEFLKKNQVWLNSVVLPYLLSSNTRKGIEGVLDLEETRFLSLESLNELISTYDEVENITHLVSSLSTLGNEMDQYFDLLPKLKNLKNLRLELNPVHLEDIIAIKRAIPRDCNLDINSEFIFVRNRVDEFVRRLPIHLERELTESLLSFTYANDLLNSDIWNRTEAYLSIREAGADLYYNNTIALNLSIHWNSIDMSELIEIQSRVDEVVNRIPTGLGTEFVTFLRSITSLDDLLNSDIWNQIQAYLTIREAGTDFYYSNTIALNLSTHWNSIDMSELIEIQSRVDEVVHMLQLDLANEIVESLKSITSLDDLLNSDIWKQVSNN